jgi:Peptidase family M1 domain
MACLRRTSWLVGALLLLSPPARAQDDDASIRGLLNRLETIVQQADRGAFDTLLAGTADRGRVEEFADLELRDGATKVVIQERDRQHLQGTLPGNGYRLVIDAFIESADRARISTIQLDIKKVEDEWLVADGEQLSVVDNLFRLSVTPDKQFSVANVKIASEDLDLTLVEGSVFVVETDRGITGLVFTGRGDMTFRPSPETEQTQVRIFSGAETLASRFEVLYVRAANMPSHIDLSALAARPVDQRDLRRAQQIFREESPKSFALDLPDLTRDTWSLLPGEGDFLAEVRTRRFSALTYSRSRDNAEDVSLFDRRRGRTIAAYASKAKLEARGRFYNEDDLAGYDVLDHEVDVAFTPERRWLEGRATLRLRTRAFLGQITLRLAQPLVVQSVYSSDFGRLFHLRVRNQDTVLVNLPAGLPPDVVVALTVVYAGRLNPQTADQENQQVEPPGVDASYLPRAEPSFLYSNRSYWHPQPPVSDYATATLRITVPAAYSCIATGEPAADSPTLVPGKETSQNHKVYTFSAARPARYFSFVVSRLTQPETSIVKFDRASEGSGGNGAAEPAIFGAYENLEFRMQSQPRQLQRGREVARQAMSIARFYESIVGDSPYQSFSLAVLENLLPGGHSPAYFAIVNQPIAGTPVTWRNDPASFQNYPEFFVAHEVAHQWWGHAIGWRNYHEQWLSEGFAQYFAALYAQRSRDDDVFRSVMRQMRRWAIDESDQGPVYLGYRLGHVKNESRVFRALVYNKSAVVLHMLRRLIGDDAFFSGIRRFYADSRFRKAGTVDLQAAMEVVAGRSLERFFERWIYGATLPRLRFSHRLEPAGRGQQVVLRIDQDGELFDVPVTVTLQYADRSVDVVVPVTERTVEVRVPLEGTLRDVEISEDDGTLAEVVETS